MTEYMIVLWCLGGMVLTLFFRQIDEWLQKPTRRVLGWAGNLFGVDKFDVARAINRFSIPPTIVYVALHVISMVQRHSGFLLFVAVLNSLLLSLFVSVRVFLYVPELVRRCEADQRRSMLSGALDFRLWTELKKDRRVGLATQYFCLLMFPAPDLIRYSLVAGLLIYVTLTTLISRVLSVEQPPYSYVSLRERIGRWIGVLRPATEIGL